MHPKRIFAVSALSILINAMASSPADAEYRDLSPNSAIAPAVNYFIDQEILDGTGFFKPDNDMPAIFFWDIVIRDTGFKPEESATFNTSLPPNISEDDEHAQILREAVRRGFISNEKDFDKMATVRRLEAIQWIVKTKGILTPSQASTRFKEKVGGVPPTAKYLADVESAYASMILEDKDIKDLKAHEPLKRKDLVRWLYNWHDNGEKNIPSLVPKASSDTQYNYQRRQKDSKSTTNNIQTININARKNIDVLVFEESLKQLENKYKFEEELTDEKKQEIINAGIKAMVSELGDKYTTYVTPDKADDFKSGLEGKFEGIGAYVEMVEEKFTITSPIKGSPAQKAKIRPGDIVTHVDGEDISGQSINDIIMKIRGTAGTEVRLTIERKGSLPKDYTVIRGKITVPDITLEFKNGIPIIGMHQFNRDTGDHVIKMLQNDVLPKEPRGIIFDLRNNPGGFLTAAVDVGRIFAKNGEVIFTTEYKTTGQTYLAEKDGLLSSTPNLVFLQNKGSASASEILTAMIKDHERGEIIGTNSLGKGTVQEIVSFSNGGSLKVTVAKWLSPNGNWIDEIGVTPDVEVTDPTDQEKIDEVDRQMQTAIQKVLQN